MSSRSGPEPRLAPGGFAGRGAPAAHLDLHILDVKTLDGTTNYLYTRRWRLAFVRVRADSSSTGAEPSRTHAALPSH